MSVATEKSENEVEPGAPVRLVVGVDGSKGAEAAIGAVAERQWPRGAEARVVNSSWKILASPSGKTLSHFAERDAGEHGGAERMVEAAAEKLQTVGIATSMVVEDEEPKRLLLSEAENWGANLSGQETVFTFDTCDLGLVIGLSMNPAYGDPAHGSTVRNASAGKRISWSSPKRSSSRR